MDQQIATVPPLPSWWVGTRSADDAKGPFQIFIGGSPERKGDEVTPASLSAVAGTLRVPSDAHAVIGPSTPSPPTLLSPIVAALSPTGLCIRTIR